MTNDEANDEQPWGPFNPWAETAVDDAMALFADDMEDALQLIRRDLRFWLEEEGWSPTQITAALRAAEAKVRTLARERTRQSIASMRASTAN